MGANHPPTSAPKCDCLYAHHESMPCRQASRIAQPPIAISRAEAASRLTDESVMRAISIAEPEYRGDGMYRCSQQDLALMRAELLAALFPPDTTEDQTP